MKKFLAIYTGSQSALEKTGWNALDDAARRDRQQAGIRAWGEWVASHRESILDPGTPLGKTRRASREGIADVTNNITAYVIVAAESHEAAAEMFENHPHFTIFPGDSVEIMECLPLPGQ